MSFSGERKEGGDANILQKLRAYEKEVSLSHYNFITQQNTFFQSVRIFPEKKTDPAHFSPNCADPAHFVLPLFCEKALKISDTRQNASER